MEIQVGKVRYLLVVIGIVVVPCLLEVKQTGDLLL